VSRNGNRFASFTQLADELASSVRVHAAVLDGELVCVDRDGRPQFYDLLYRRRPPYFFAFDLLFHNGVDLRFLPLTELRRSSGPVLAVDHVNETGTALFERVCALDLEGIVAASVRPAPASICTLSKMLGTPQKRAAWEPPLESVDLDHNEISASTGPRESNPIRR
jgi:ATP-dependent DNA ligase